MGDCSKKIVLHLHTLPIVSGSGINTFLTMKLSDKTKIKSILACAPDGELEKLVKENGFKFIPIPDLDAPLHPIKDIKAFIQIFNVIQSVKPDIIHTHNSKAGFLGRLAGKLAGTKKIVHTVHGYAFHNAEKRWKQILYIILEKFAAYFSTDIIFISNVMLSWAKKYNLIKNNNFYLIYSGIQVDKFKNISLNKDNLKKSIGIDIDKDDFLIGEVAKLWEGKGHETIINTAELLKHKYPDINNIKFVFIGDGYLKDKLLNIVKNKKLENTIFFTGFREDIPELTSTLDAALLISDYEGMGRVILEAMICKVPVIATAVGGILDLIEDNKTGLLIQPDDKDSLAEKILLLYNNKKLRKKLADNAYQNISEKYSAETMVKKIEKVYLSN